ncbi:BgTH12-03587 [Blumeria graminis f. sp. triticale]|uniref:Bgt-3298 n=3 Tax=Blumeria graminis TaxID=34373 RepID=A0A061HDF1_BLUGR|nr:hypothetical protein BGT96224_3298 [Blumeria graminis f. sp. tritici 96224]CAD6499471.1 BgTH12-03587 [Blumeria graminis f. sp. triticale]VCU39633.1 Bgt-3298 [Blumeria graminis f. sp. tritici]
MAQANLGNEDEKTADGLTKGAPSATRFFSIPGPIRSLFDKVPIILYPPNRLPSGPSRYSQTPLLFVYTTAPDAIAGRPSFNPGCLKWQTFLKMAGIQHELIPSNNHASPSGALPFLLPGVHNDVSSPGGREPVVANKILKYAKEHGCVQEEFKSVRKEAYLSLLDYRVRDAWLCFLYLEPSNFDRVAYPRYVSPVSSNLLVRSSISRQLQAAAELELLKHSSIIDVNDLYSEADKAFEALSTLLGDNMWFFGKDKPTLFDASVFAYSHLLLDENMDWVEEKLCGAIKTRQNLVQHRLRILSQYYSDKN